LSCVPAVRYQAPDGSRHSVNVMLVPIIAGTALSRFKDEMLVSSVYPAICWLPLPLVPSSVLSKHFWSQLVPVWALRTVPGLQNLLALVGGHMRTVETTVVTMLTMCGESRNPEKMSWTDLIMACNQLPWNVDLSLAVQGSLVASLVAKYQSVWASTSHGLFAAIVLNVPVMLRTQIGDSTVESLVGRAPIALEEIGLGSADYLLRTSAIVLHAWGTALTARSSRLAAAICEVSRSLLSEGSLEPKAFEKFTARFLCMQRNARYCLHDEAPHLSAECDALGTLFPGAVFLNRADIKVMLPVPTIRAVTVETLRKRFPDSVDALDDAADLLVDGKAVVVNGEGAPFADVFTYDVGKERCVRLWVQCKAYVRGEISISAGKSGVVAEAQKVVGNISRVPAPLHDGEAPRITQDVFVYFSYGRLAGRKDENDATRRSAAGSARRTRWGGNLFACIERASWLLTCIGRSSAEPSSRQHRHAHCGRLPRLWVGGDTGRVCRLSSFDLCR
jgi:hypothetical protein